jgi:hypothetical protein
VALLLAGGVAALVFPTRSFEPAQATTTTGRVGTAAGPDLGGTGTCSVSWVGSSAAVRVRSDGAPLSAVIALLAERADRPIRIAPEADGLLHLDEREFPGWLAALDACAELSGRVLDPRGDALHVIVPELRVSLIERDADIREVALRIARRAGRRRIVLDPEFEGRLTIQLEDLPWPDALRRVVASTGRFELVEVGDELRVGRLEPRVKLHAADQDVREVIADVGRQAGKRIDVDPSLQGRITLELADVSWSVALRAIVRTAGAFEVVDLGDGRVSVVPTSSIKAEPERECPVRLGMSRAEVRAALGAPARTVDRFVGPGGKTFEVEFAADWAAPPDSRLGRREDALRTLGPPSSGEERWDEQGVRVEYAGERAVSIELHGVDRGTSPRDANGHAGPVFTKDGWLHGRRWVLAGIHIGVSGADVAALLGPADRSTDDARGGVALSYEARDLVIWLGRPPGYEVQGFRLVAGGKVEVDADGNVR